MAHPNSTYPKLNWPVNWLNRVAIGLELQWAELQFILAPFKTHDMFEGQKKDRENNYVYFCYVKVKNRKRFLN